MKDNFPHAISFVLYWEKWKSDNPKDPGGLTIWGICQRDYPDEVNTMLGMSEKDSRVYAERFYRREFWDAMGCDDLQGLIDIVIFDCSVNQGKARAKAIARNACNWADAILLKYDYYDDIKLFTQFGRGWSRRAISLRNYIVTKFRVLEWDPKELVKAEL